MIIAKLQNSTQTRLMQVSKAQRSANKAGNVSTIQFNDFTPLKMHLKDSCSVLDYKQIAKHYLVKSTSHGQSWKLSLKGEFDDTLPGTKR